MKNTIFISLLFVSTLGLFGNKVTAIPTNKNAHSLFLDTSRYTILQFNEGYTFAFDKNAKPDTLSTKEIAKIEKLIEKEVTKYNKNGGKHRQIKNPLNYYKQFIAVVNPKGEKQVWVSCYCQIRSPNWKKELMMVKDGGTCYFQLKVNLTKNTVYEFSVNGEA